MRRFHLKDWKAVSLEAGNRSGVSVPLDIEKPEQEAEKSTPVAEEPAALEESVVERPPEERDQEPPQVQVEEVPILPVRDTVLFPHGLLPISVGRPGSVALVRNLGENRSIGILAQLDARAESPAPGELHTIGTLVMIHKIVPMREGLLLFCEGVSRMRALEFVTTEPYLRARIEKLTEIEPQITPE